ncbi:Holliday junction branch migration protein RuvA [Mumia sp. zg.B53]|uniref:Holliday junction branch migration protein RuvA n=1 Tax=unclassified Mumia TaxID=2621872 RepID=UPI001C6F540B|nr:MULTISPECIES: Holliday junction branch migration protein RuvA [unclassified Mumia]MBW9216811.1 Holliday junction branch migration protein RuvA [Mumia sp. zg.B53]MDD9349242.1 Holliday junction branch migration protein RuvA [Mumia sp.]
MIAFVRGTVASTALDSAVLDVGGVGMLVQCTPGTLADLRHGEQAQVSTSLVVREDSMTLYGFADDDERDTFELAQTASGVGPKVAQAIIAVLGPEGLRRAVAEENLVALTKVPGIGRKGAQRIVLELKDRLGAAAAVSQATATAPASTPADADWRPQVHAALVGLGWSTREAESAVAAVVTVATEQIEGTGAVDVSVLLRAALRTLSKA